VYVESAHRREDLRALVAIARDAGWHFAAGTRLDDALPGIKWDRLLLPPLRERPDDLRALAGWYLEVHTRRLGLPKRAFDRGMWALLHAHRWPGNHRELEMFVIQVLGRVDQPMVRGAALPADLRALLSPHAEAEREVESFEEMARVRLQPVVRAYTPGPSGTLHELVVRSAERALLQLVLARTQGNRKAAAALLGLARNTLQARIRVLGLDATGRETG
jgi:DNA-binding NtrC family response regulator